MAAVKVAEGFGHKGDLCGVRTTQGSENPPNTGAVPANRSQWKRARYENTPSKTKPDAADVARVYGERFGADSPQDNHAYRPKGTGAVELVDFTEGHVLRAIKGLSLDSASGPDNITGKMIAGWGVDVVRPILNSFLWTGKIPDQLRVNRTTLITQSWSG
ncbi:hypothetical protein FJT64_007411 [Amphibalanus amphitrite]|uniref:Uncharacterized protein n=1 Tax=Amphibalanus amphitrite TaxID=1232801 RepID=A0A6A4VPZ8_AMPAM|nr:hypothetical protein FJT64_007411 [Amphibalanus amphitrite]